MRALACLATLTLLAAAPAGCARFPALDDTITPEAEAAAYPALVPIEPLLADGPAGADTDARQDEAALMARAAALRARAAELRRTTP
ncbi:hypothetical protein [Sediminimonas sp.]|uniref:hypothetical protein n=1 Tax=Sediminimonas sp. TaxID=2823379 RepID=UPI00260156D6|nr:hypothetical protein [Sediminimonas sp.]